MAERGPGPPAAAAEATLPPAAAATAATLPVALRVDSFEP